MPPAAADPPSLVREELGARPVERRDHLPLVLAVPLDRDHRRDPPQTGDERRGGREVPGHLPLVADEVAGDQDHAGIGRGSLPQEAVEQGAVLRDVEVAEMDGAERGRRQIDPDRVPKQQEPGAPTRARQRGRAGGPALLPRDVSSQGACRPAHRRLAEPAQQQQEERSRPRTRRCGRTRPRLPPPREWRRRARRTPEKAGSGTRSGGRRSPGSPRGG